MRLQTASETISFSKAEIEEKAAKLYDDLASRFDDKGGDFSTFAKENRKFAKQIQMAYQHVITDAIEGCYAFDLESDDHILDTDLAQGASLSDAVAKAIATEDKIIAFYEKATEQSGPLLADVPRNFKIIVKKRNKRLDTLKSM